LAVNFTHSNDLVELKLEYIFNKCIAYYKDFATCPPTKDAISKILQQLFGVQSSIACDSGNRHIVYKHLCDREEKSSSITVPDYCTVSVLTSGYINMTCPLTFAINGQQQQCEITLGCKESSVKVRGKECQCGIGFDPTQKSVDGMIYLAQSLRMCQGIPSTVEHSQTFVEESLSQVHDENSTRAVLKSRSCKILLNWCSRNDMCDTCKDSHQTYIKRMSKKRTASEPLVPPNPEEEDDESTIKLSLEDHEDMQTILDAIVANGAPENLHVLLKSRLSNCKKGLEIHQRRWDPHVISVCLGIFLRSPQAYTDLNNSGFLVLPSKRLLQYYKNSVKQSPGFVQNNFTWMTKEADKQKVSDFGKHGGLVIDEMSLQDDLVITRQGDTWNLVGVVDMDETNNNIDVICQGKKRVRLATHALQFVFHGLTGFRWPVVYFGSCTATAHQLYTTFWKCVYLLDDCGFTVDYLMADGASTNRSFTSMLFTGTPRQMNYTFPDVFCRDHAMYAIQDIMHVIKKIRNNVESSKGDNRRKTGRYLIFNEKCIVWEHWEESFKFNFQNGFAIHQKLTDEHINLTPASKMRNQLAVHVLNKDMLYLMKCYQATLQEPERLASSVELLEHTALLVDIFCDHNRPLSPLQDVRFTTLTKVIKFFNSWETQIVESATFIPKKHLITSETRDDINSSVTGFVALCQQLVRNGNSINPGFINSDLVENLFGQQRGIRNGLNTNPTLAQYGPANTAIILGQCSVSSKSNSGKTASFFSATTPCPLNPGRNKDAKNKKRAIRI
jgi:hypothetical protein